MPNTDFFLTSGDDNKIIKWNLVKKQCVELCKIQALPADAGKGKKKSSKFKGGASTLST